LTLYVVVPAVPEVGVIVGATVFTGAGGVYVTEPLPVLELVLSVGEVCGADPGVNVEETPDCPLLEYTVTELARTVPDTFPSVTTTLTDDAVELPVELYVPFARPAFVIV
jgi:hypothetical protein